MYTCIISISNRSIIILTILYYYNEEECEDIEDVNKVDNRHN